jgi:nicotinate-nucleotide adenylyltransferase
MHFFGKPGTGNSMKTALYFGSFNPIHIGHLAIANYIAEFGGVDEVWFVVSPQNPLKNKHHLLPGRNRLELVECSLGDYPKFRVSDIEFGLAEPSYTIHTLTHLRERFPNRTFSLVLGSDNLAHFHKWKNYDQLLTDYELLVYPRRDTPKEVWDKYPSVKRMEAPQMEISSTFIREALKNGKDIRFFMPEPAWNLIQKMNWYMR